MTQHEREELKFPSSEVFLDLVQYAGKDFYKSKNQLIKALDSITYRYELINFVNVVRISRLDDQYDLTWETVAKEYFSDEELVDCFDPEYRQLKYIQKQIETIKYFLENL